MTYLELEFPSVDAARAATKQLEAMDITGEWYMRKAHTGEAWRLSIASEVDLRQDHIARLGGKVLDEEAAAGRPSPTDDEA